eukprot:TRINITY_DN57962_c0_g1_i1.p1 TRINITY_DN57962_c0_g1~~TRINITY_DN57962_c0_g1_i1.p1  ORF type:complete len:378 (+),score=61.48 TRINITY_DN57962_c0_g1_i1:83-1135(+)
MAGRQQQVLLPQRVVSPWPPPGGNYGILGTFVAAVGELLAAEGSCAELLTKSPPERESVVNLRVCLWDRKPSRDCRRGLEELASEAELIEEEVLSELHSIVERGGAWDPEIAELPPVVAGVAVAGSTLMSLGQPGAVSGRLELLRDAGDELRAGWQLLGGLALEGLAPFAEPIAVVRAGATRERLRVLSRGGGALLMIAIPLPDAAALQAAQLKAWRCRAKSADAEAANMRRVEAQLRLRRSTERSRIQVLRSRGVDVESIAADEEPPLQPAGLEGRVRLEEYRTTERLVNSYKRRQMTECSVSDFGSQLAGGTDHELQRSRVAACLDCSVEGVCWKHVVEASTREPRSP